MASALAPPRDLTIPEAGSTTARGILSRAIGRLLREITMVSRGAPASAHAVAAAIERIARSTPPGALASALRRPTVAAPLRCLRHASPAQKDALLVELLGQLAFDLAQSGALADPVTLARPPTRLLSIPARVARCLVPGPTTITNGGDVKGATVEPSYYPIARDIVLALADNNPLALVDAHPDKSGNAIDLGGRSPEVWCEELARALSPIERHMPDLRNEIDLFVSQVVPVGWDAERHLSASYQEAIGTVYMTLHPSSMTLTEALIHEFSHNKLNALFELDDVLENAWSPLYTSPVRPDPRPLHGVLLAVHAFLPVERLYVRMIEAGDPAAARDDFRQRLAAIQRINQEGAELLLAEARPTPVGAGLLDEIRRLHEAR